MARGRFTRWVRKVSQRQLLTDAQTRMARTEGRAVARPHGQDVFWQKVYAPVYHRLPISLRNRVVASMPGSHRRTWTYPAPADGPALSLARAVENGRKEGRAGTT